MVNRDIIKIATGVIGAGLLLFAYNKHKKQKTNDSPAVLNQNTVELDTHANNFSDDDACGFKEFLSTYEAKQKTLKQLVY